MAASAAFPSDPFAACDEARAAAPGTWAPARCFYQRALEAGDLAGGAEALDSRLAATPADHWLRCARGHIAAALGDPAAPGFYRVAAEGFAAAGEPRGQLLALRSLHHYLLARGRHAEAAEVVAEAMASLDAGTPALMRAEIELLAAEHEVLGRGDLARACRLLERALPALEASGTMRQRLSALWMLATTSRDLGRAGAAEVFYRRLETAARGQGQSDLLAAARMGLALLALDRADRRPNAVGRAWVIAALEAALEAAEGGRNRSVALHAHRLLGDLTSDDAAAAEHHRRCLELAAQTGNDSARSACLLSTARRLGAVDWQRARALLDEALALPSDVPERARVHFERTVLAWRFEPRERAWEASLEAFDAVEALRRRQRDPGGRAGVFALWLDPYYQVVGALLGDDEVGAEWNAADDRDLRRAFAVSERIRARVLLETMRWMSPAGSDADVERGCPSASTERVQAALAGDEAVLSFLLNNRRDLFGRPTGGAWLLALTAGDLRAYRLPERMRLEPAIELTLGLLADRDAAAGPALGRLHHDLLATVLADLPPVVRKLTVIADGALHELPLGALRATAAGPPLVTAMRVDYAPSASFLVCRRSARSAAVGAASAPAASRPVLVLADPAFGPVPGADDRADIDVPDVAAGLGRLPHARREARSVRRHVGRGRSTVRLDAEAREADLAALIAAGDEPPAVLHLAAHAVVDDRHPERSAVLMAPGGGDGADADGRLEPREILELDLAGALVVLSACRSAGGTIESGEGVISLARAFFQAGASAVVGSLWPLHDDLAADRFDHFYRHLAAGASVGDALAAAQRQAIAAGEPAAAWAGLVAIGDADLVPLPGGEKGTFGWPAAIVAAALVLVAVAAARRRRVV